MAHSKDIEDIPKSTVRAVAKKLKYYVDVQRREEAFDLSGVEHPMGAFTTHKGGSLYYNAMQDKLTAHFLSQPQLKKYTNEMGLKSPTKASPRPCSGIMNFIKQDSTMSQDSGKLLNTTSKLLLSSNIKHLDRTGSAPSTLRSPATATHRLHRHLSNNSTISSSTNSDLASRSYPRKKRPSRQIKQSTPVTHSAPVVSTRKTNFQPLIQRIDLESSISSNASSLQSSVNQSQEDDDLMQYTYHGVARKPSVTDTLLTRSDSALCVPSMQKRIVSIKKKKVTAVVNGTLSSKEPVNDATDNSNNNSSSLPVQESNSSTQDASIQVDSSKSLLLDQPTDDKKAAVQPTTIGRTASVHSIGLQVTESCDSSTQTLSEVGIQTDLSAIMDQKRAERRRLKKQSRESASLDSSDPPTVIITSDSKEQLKQKTQSDANAFSPSSQDLEAAKKEELRRHIAATTIQQYYRGFKSGIRAKKSEQQLREQELSSAQKKLPAGVSIHEAARTGNVDRIKELSTEASSLINLLDERGYTPLHCATENGALESVKMLSICGADMHKETPTGYTPIHIAALSGHVNCLKLLHALECSLKCQTVDRKTPLHLAAMCGHMECCKWLLSNRAKLNVRDVNDRTALQLAEESGQSQIVDLLTSYENELKYAKGALKQLRSRRSSSTEHTDDEGWLSDAKQPDSPAIKFPATIVEEQKQFYEQIQQDKEESDSTFLDVARIAVEKELQTIEEQPDQHKLDDHDQQINDQDQQQVDQNQHSDQDQQHNEGQQNNDQFQEHNNQGQNNDQGEQHNDQGQNNDQDNQVEEHNDQDQQNDDQTQQNDQDKQAHDQGNNQDQQLFDHSQSQQQINDQTNTNEPNNEQTEKTSTTGADNQDETPTDKQLQSEVPIQTTHTPPTIAEKINMEEVVTAVTAQHDETEDTQKDDITNLPSTQNVVTATDEDTSTTKPALPELISQDAPQQESTPSVTQDANSPLTLQQDNTDGAKDASESDNTTDEVAELSVANLAAHDMANPPLIERTDTQQTLTTVTMLDNPIRLEQLSRSSLDSDYSKKQQQQLIVQTVSPTAGDSKPNNDDVIAITGTVNNTGAKFSISSSSLSNVTDLTE